MTHDPKREELYHLAGDAPDPDGSMARGQQATMRLTQTALGHPMIRYKDRVIEADVYLMGTQLMVHLICPRCRHALRITSDRKKMEYDARENVLSVEPMKCTWEMDENRQEFGVSLCNWTAGIDKNVARDA